MPKRGVHASSQEDSRHAVVATFSNHDDRPFGPYHPELLRWPLRAEALAPCRFHKQAWSAAVESCAAITCAEKTVPYASRVGCCGEALRGYRAPVWAGLDHA